MSILPILMIAAPAGSLVNDYAQCLVRNAPRQVAKTLDASPGEPFETAVSRLSIRKCSRPVDLVSSDLRGSLFAEMYQKFGPQAGRTAANYLTSWVPPLPKGSPLISWYQFSSCLVQRSPERARALVRAPSDSKSVDTNLEGMMPALQSCLPSDSQVRIGKNVLRGLLAETVYRLDLAPKLGTVPY